MRLISKILFAYEKKNSFFHSCDPISKIVWLICLSTLSLLITRALPQIALLLVVVATGIVLARITPNEVGLLVVVFSGLALGWFLIQSLLIGGSHTLLEIGPIRFASEGVDAAGAVAFRSVILVMLARVFVGTTEPREMALSFVQKLRLPYSFAFGVFLTLRLLPLFEQEFRDLQDARKARGADSEIGVKHYFSLVRDYATTLLVRGLRRSVITAYSLDSRAFRAKPYRTYLKSVHITPQGEILSIVSVAVIILAFLRTQIFK